MTENDIDDFFDLLDGVYDLIGKTPAARVISPGAKEMFFRAVRQHSLADVRAALDHHASHGKFTPVPADVNSYIEARKPVVWVSADEAWGQVPKLESEAGLLNQVTAAALVKAQPLLDAGDKVAARRTFIDAYDRLVEVAKVHPDPAQRVPVTFVSGGNLPMRDQDTLGERQMLIERAADQGLLPAPAAAPALPAPTAAGRAQFKLAMSQLKMKSLPPPEASE